VAFFQDNLDKPAPERDSNIWILMKHTKMQCQQHQLDHMKIICTLLQTNNHAYT